MSVTVPLGFQAAGVAAGIKKNGRHDLTVVVADAPASVAAMFTVNRFPAAPVQVSKAHVADGGGRRAVVVNSGGANAGTGAAGLEDARAMARLVAAAIGCEASDVLVCSTGTIGPRLPMDRIAAGIEEALDGLDRGPATDLAAARGIMTTDSVPKLSSFSGDGFAVGGIAKGAGMVRPDMATMLVVMTTDAVVAPGPLQEALRRAVDGSFHELNIDGCGSTNDTVFLLASGASGVEPSTAHLDAAIGAVARDLAEQLAADAEGADRVVTIDVIGASTDAVARSMGRKIADSALVRAAFYGGDPNWGRLAGALGAGPDPFDPDELAIAFAGVEVARSGVAVDHDEAALVEKLAKGDFRVEIMVGDGPGRASVLTTDLTPAYVEFNGERS